MKLSRVLTCIQPTLVVVSVSLSMVSFNSICILKIEEALHVYMRGEALHALTNDSITRYWGQLMQQLFSGATVLTKPHEQLQQCTPYMYV